MMMMMMMNVSSPRDEQLSASEGLMETDMEKQSDCVHAHN